MADTADPAGALLCFGEPWRPHTIRQPPVAEGYGRRSGSQARAGGNQQSAAGRAPVCGDRL